MAALTWTLYVSVAINIAALAIIAARADQLGFWHFINPGSRSVKVCGHLDASDFILHSERVVYNKSISPAAGKPTHTPPPPPPPARPSQGARLVPVDQMSNANA